jgi:DNA-binding transcriptional ArsR family regulator
LAGRTPAAATVLLQKSFAPIRIERGLGAAELRALAHPLRLRMLGLLREGPATASQLGRALGESSGATSYHLRVLASVGMVEEDVDRGNARERWWRRPDEIVIVSAVPGTGDEEYEAAQAQLKAVFLEFDEQAMERYLQLREQLGERGEEATYIGNFRVEATVEEISELRETILRLVDALRRPPEARPEGTIPVHVTFRALPQALPPEPAA